MRKRTLNFNVRADGESGHRLVGTPIVFNTRTTIFEGMDETIEPTALDHTDLSDVKFLVNHDTSQLPLARYVKGSANNTMDISIDQNGVNISVELDVENNQRARDLYSAVQRGDVSGMSFMFDVSTFDEVDEPNGTRLNRITEIAKVYEVSAVTFPAYESTTIEARNRLQYEKPHTISVETLKLKCKILGGF